MDAKGPLVPAGANADGHVNYGTVEKHAGIFTKLHLDTDPHSHRRVQAVLHHLRTRSP